MTVLRRVVCAMVLGAALLLADGTAVAGQGALEEGAAAPRNAWGMEAGCAARSGVARTPMPRGPVERAWSLDAAGPLRGEPRVSGRWALLDVDAGAGKRHLQMIDLATGKPGPRKQFKTGAALMPCVAKGVVVLRTGPNRLEAYRIYPGGPVGFWSVKTDVTVGDVLFLGGKVYVRGAGGITCYTLGRSRPTWSHMGKTRGRLAARGGGLYVVEYDTAGNAQLMVLDRETGSVISRVGVGHHKGTVPPESADTRVAVFDNVVHVHHALPVPLKSGVGVKLVELKRTVHAGGRVVLSLDGYLDVLGETMPFAGGWFGVLRGERSLVHMERDGKEYSVLATRDTGPLYVSRALAPSRGPQAGFLQLAAIELGTQRVLWTLPERPTGRVVPVRGGVLVRTGDRTLSLWRSSGDGGTEPLVLASSKTSSPPFDGILVSRGGDVRRGKLTLDVAKKTVSLEGKGAAPTWPTSDVALLAGTDSRLILAAEGDELLDALEAVTDDLRAREYAQLARAAGAADDLDLLERMIEAATQQGAPRADLDWAEKRRKVLRKRKNLNPKAARVKAVLERERALALLGNRVLWQTFEALPDAAPSALRFDLLRAVLARDPGHEEAVAIVRGMVPKGIEPDAGREFSAREWLDFVEVARSVSIELVPRPRPDDPDLTHGERTYGSLLHTWRKDLVALRSEQLMIVTPLARPGSVARCIAMGELVCTKLEEFFADGKRRRETRYPLTILLYESEEEYRGLGDFDAGMGHIVQWSAGHYSPADELSRLYLPDDDAEFQRVMAVFAHELTHQWIQERCPLFGTADRHKGNTAASYWIVEGFAEMVEGFEFDLRTRGFRVQPRTDPVDIVAQVAADKLIPWSSFFDLTHSDFWLLSKEVSARVPISHRLGYVRKLSPTHLFYAQGSTVCLYLFQAEGGKHRKALMEYLGARYRGEPPGIQEAFGMTPEELGKKAVAFAREMTSR